MTWPKRISLIEVGNQWRDDKMEIHLHFYLEFQIRLNCSRGSGIMNEKVYGKRPLPMTRRRTNRNAAVVAASLTLPLP